MTATCETCRWWKPPLPVTTNKGECHGGPPQAKATAAIGFPRVVAHVLTYWPGTAADDWCGSWAPKPAGNVAEPSRRELALVAVVKRYIGDNRQPGEHPATLCELHNALAAYEPGEAK